MLKRLMDIIISLTALALLWPVMLAVALVVRVKLGPGVLFWQVRPGLRGKPFTMVKFRTMTDACGGDGKLLPDCDRLPPFGRFLRATSLDELPELFNVLAGSMSLVGPRPLLMQYLERYTPRQARRMEVRPGITGWAQVKGRNALAWEDKFELDVWYVDNRSLLLDFKILLMTLGTIFSANGVCQEGEATAAEFMGSGQKVPGNGDTENPVGNHEQIR